MRPVLPRLIPCRHDKSPHIAEWQHRATSNPDQLRSWEDEFPGCLWGVLCGEVFDVVDVDPAGLWWAFEHEAELKTYTQVTRRRGLHLFFQPTPGLRSPTNCPVEGVDIRASGTIVIDWRRAGFPFIERPRLVMPDWLIEAIATKQGSKKPPLASSTGRNQNKLPPDLYLKVLRICPLGPLVKRRHQRRLCSILSGAAHATEGERNVELNKAAFAMREPIAQGLITREDAKILLLDATTEDDPNKALYTIRSGLGSDFGQQKRPVGGFLEPTVRDILNKEVSDD